MPELQHATRHHRKQKILQPTIDAPVAAQSLRIASPQHLRQMQSQQLSHSQALTLPTAPVRLGQSSLQQANHQQRHRQRERSPPL